jgi:germination protein M
VKAPPAPASFLALGVALGLVLSGCGSESAVSLGPPQTGSTPSSEVTQTVPTALSLEVWFARGGKLVAERRTHKRTPGVAAAAVEALLAGPTQAEHAVGIATAIPAGTRLLGISIRDRVATVDLTSEYQSGGGSLSMQVRLGQVVYTLTQFPSVGGVRFHLDGAPVNVFSSEGIVLDHPVGRTDYEDLLPVIVVAQPATGARVTSPLRVSGSANVFEANVTVKVLDAKGKVVGRTFATATCGTGCRGTYLAPVSFGIDREQPGTVVVSDDDAAGTGTPPHVVRVPVVLVPGAR